MKKQIKIEGMHCTRCHARVENALSPFGQVTVDLDAGIATVLCDVDNAVLQEEIEALGFDVIAIETL